jgi:hypothetical protein
MGIVRAHHDVRLAAALTSALTAVLTGALTLDESLSRVEWVARTLVGASITRPV